VCVYDLRMSRAVISALFTLLAAAMAQLPVEKDVTVLTDATMAAALLENEYTFVMFYAPWCPHCQEMLPKLEAVSRVCKRHNVNALIAKVDADANSALSEKYEIKGYPRLKLFHRKEFVDYDYTQEPTGTEIFEWIRKKVGLGGAATFCTSPHPKTLMMN